MNWALEQRQLKPAPWRVLVMLADRHNKDTLRVDPEQALLAHDCNMSRSTVNRHLEALEASALLVRVPRVNPQTQKQMPTFYVLAIDFDGPPEIEFAVSDYKTRIAQVQTGNEDAARVPNSDTGAVSQKQQIPCPKNRKFRVSNSDTNPVREPGIEPCAAAHDFDFEVFFGRFADLHPRLGKADETAELLRLAIEAGIDPEDILWGARCYAIEQKGNAARYIAYSENWVRDRRWESHPRNAGATATERDIQVARAKAIRECQPWVISRISAVSARELIALGLVTEEECEAAGIRV